MGFFQNTFNNVKSSNQKNAQQSATQISKPKTTRDVLNQINLLRQTDKASADEYTKKLFTSMQDPSSRFYNPYNQATNKAVTNLQNLGFDMSSIDDDWYNRNSWLKDYYVQTANTNGLSSTMTNKRASKEQKAAYNYNQLWQAEENTKKAENEWNELQKELSYWAQRTDRNYSDEEIIGKIDWDKYKTLRKMDDTRLAGTPMELNRGIGYSEDAMYGVLWAARNGGSTGNLWLDMANSADGTGYKYNPEIASKLDPNSEDFNPYALGSTNLDKAALHFGVNAFTDEFFQQNNGLQYEDSEDGKYFRQAMEGRDNQAKVDEATNALKSWMNRYARDMEPEKAKAAFDRMLSAGKVYVDGKQVDISILNKIDKTIGKGDELGTGDLIAMTKGSDYKYDTALKEFQDMCTAKSETGNGYQYSNTIAADAGVAGVVPFNRQQQAVIKETDKKREEDAAFVESAATPAEQAVNKNQISVTYDDVKNVCNTVKQVGLNIQNAFSNKMIRNSVGRTASSVLNGTDVIAGYEQDAKTVETLTAKETELKNELGNLIYHGQEVSDVGDITIDFEGNKINLQLYYDDLAGTYAVSSVYNKTTNSFDLSSFDQDALNERINGVVTGVNGHRDEVVSANSTQITEEQQKKLDEYKGVVEQLDGLVAKQEQNKEAYDAAIKERSDAEKLRNDTIRLLRMSGCSDEQLQEFENTNTVIDALTDFTKYDPTEWESYNTYDLYAQYMLFEGAENYSGVLETAKQGDEKNAQEIEMAQWLLDYSDRMGIEIPDNVRNNINRYIAKLERNHQDYEYFSMLGNDDFKSGAEKGHKLAEDDTRFDWSVYAEGGLEALPLWNTLSEDQQAQLTALSQSDDPAATSMLQQQYEYDVQQMNIENRMYGLSMLDNLLTDYEKETYYYLLGTQGVSAAEEYYQHLSDDYGVLSKRYTELVEQAGKDLADQGFLGRRAADVASMILAPAAAIGSFAYGVKQGFKKLTGQENEYNPNDPSLAFNNFRTSAREEINKKIVETYGEGSFLQQVASGLQEMVSNRGDSIANALAFGWLTGGIPNDMIQEFIGAIPMATSAAFDAMNEAKEKGATEEQLWAIGGVTLFAESITEAVTLSNIKDAFGLGEDITADTVKQFLKNWLTKEGIEEAFGESMNDIIENFADEKIMGELSDHAQKVQAFIDSGMSEEEAEAAARRDELSGILHTALISYLSPGLDIVSTGAGRLSYYRDKTRSAQERGANVSLLDVMKADKGIRERVDADYEQIKNAPENGASVAMPEQAPVQETAPAQKESSPEQKNAQDITVDYEILESAMEADASSQTASVAAVLDFGGTDSTSDMANAAAANANKLFDEGISPAEGMQNLIIGAYANGVDTGMVKLAVQNAALSENSSAYQMMQSEDYKNADPGERAEMLASTVNADINNADVQNEIATSVYENRVARAELTVMDDPSVKQANDKAYAAQGTLLDKQAATQAAQEEYDSREAELDEKRESLRTAGDELQDNASDHTRVDMVNRAIAELQKTGEVVQEYKQHLEKAQAEEKKAQEAADKALEDAMTARRQLAQQKVDEENQQRAEAAVQAEAEAQAQAELAEQQQIEQEETDNAYTADSEGYIAQMEEKYGPMTDEEKQRVRERFNAVREARTAQEQQTVQQPEQNDHESDAFGLLNDPAAQKRRKAVKEVERRFGYRIAPIDTVKNGGFYYEGKNDTKNRVIFLDSKSITTNDIMYKVLGHELTHIAELAGEKTYNGLANSVARVFYGADANVKQAIDNLKKNNGIPTSKLEADIMKRKGDYDRQLGTNHDFGYIAQEVVADRMGEIINQKDDARREDMINRLVAEDPSAARRLMNSIKSFIKKAVGMKGAWLTNSQKTVDMLERAISKAQKNPQEQARFESDRYSLASENTLVEGEDGEPLATELPGGTVIADTNSRYSLASFTPDEQERVRQALYNKKDANGKNEFTKEEVDKYLEDAMSLAGMIAADRTRLDFDVTDPEKSMVKPNADYGASIDASTLCAKRLLYQGTFDAIQHLLPNTPLMPDDLINLANMMREMGYEVPCGICYVESRRRNLDKFADEWLQTYKGDYIPKIDEVTTSDGLEKLRKSHKQAYDDFIQAMKDLNQRNPKVVQLRTEYKGEIRDMTDRAVQKAINHGGLRLQSFSDFETPHLLDMVQVVMDMASKGLTSQAYTKVPNFAWAFGDTGIKINLSLIGKGEGVDENGKLLFDDVEGMPYEEAIKLRTKYSKNVGTILVGINDKHILAAMADPNIDFIIPFHRSGWTKNDLRLMPVIEKYKDYTLTQNERDLESGKKADKNLEPVGEEGYWDFSKTGKENADAYLDLCYKKKLIPKFDQFLDRDENGHYHLKTDGSTDGYWKTLIDFKMYDNEGNGSPQTKVTPNVNMVEAERILSEYKLERQQPNAPAVKMADNNSLPVAQPVVERYVEEYKANHPLDENRTRYSLPNLAELDERYMEAYESYDDEEGEKVIAEMAELSMPDSKVRDNDGKLKVVYHQTNADPFTVFDMNKARQSEDIVGAFFAPEYDENHEYGDRTYAVYLNITNPAYDQFFFDKSKDNGGLRKREELIAQGYDGVINTEDGKVIEYIAFYPEQIKSAEPFTEDDDGDLIPLIQRFDRIGKNKNDIRYSLPSDAPYLSAVDHGDMETAQRMVDEKANETGYTIRGYHGTNADFNSFDKSKAGSNWEGDSRFGPGFYFAHDDYTASRWTDGSRIVNAWLKMEHPLDLRDATPDDIADAIRQRFDVDRRAGAASALVPMSEEQYQENIDRLEAGQIRNPARFLSSLKYDADGNMTDGIQEFLTSLGYDGIITDEEMVVFDPEQIKSADPVTYDNQGNVIPLSERFKQTNNDIRYSLPSDDILDQQINEYLNNGGILGQNAVQNEQPSNPNMGYRQWGNEGAQRSDELADEAKQIVFNSEYARDTNAAELARAIEWVRSNKQFADDDGFNESLRQVTSKRFNYRTKDGQAKMVAVMALAAAKKDTAAQVQLAEAYNEQGTDLGQALQARKLFRLMTPQGRIATLQKMLGNVQTELDNKGFKKEIKLSDWIYEAAAEASDEKVFAKIRQAAAIELAEQIPANWKDKLRGLRMLSMLGNPRTHIRNIIGNALFVPAVGLKNKMGAIAEKAFNTGERTKTTAIMLNKDVRDFARQDAEFMKDDLTGEAKYNEGTLVQRAEKPFKGFLQALIDFNSAALEKEDWFFLKGHYRRALGGWIQANGYTVEQLKQNPELLDKGRAYAINEAQKATYRDFNGLAAKLNQLSRDPQTTGQKVLGFATEAILPFKKTPANILKRGIEYSPAGLVRGLKNAMLDVRNGKITATQAIDRICSGLAGTAVLAMGAFLAGAGCVSVGLDDDDDEMEKLKGNQKYAINPGKALNTLFNAKLFGEDVTFTMDWAAPMSMPFFVGAAIQKEYAREGNFDINEILNSMSSIAEPVFNLSMLDGVNTLFKTAQNSDTDALTQIGAKVLSNYATSYVPSLLGAITRTAFDDTRRSTYVESGKGNGVLGTFRYAMEQTENKIPGLSKTNIPVRDMFGNAETSGLVERILENFILPGYVSNYKNDPVINEMDRLYSANVTGSEKLIQKDPAKTVTYNKQKYVLTAEQWDTYKAERGQTAYKMLTELINSDDYQNATPEAQVQMFDKVWDYADKIGKKAIIPDYEMEETENPVETIATEGKVTAYNTEMIKALEAGDYVAYDTMVEALHEAGVEDSDIRKKIGDKYRDQYKEAYRKNNFDKMAEIEEILFNTGYDFDIGGWESDVDKKYGR